MSGPFMLTLFLFLLKSTFPIKDSYDFSCTILYWCTLMSQDPVPSVLSTPLLTSDTLFSTYNPSSVLRNVCKELRMLRNFVYIKKS